MVCIITKSSPASLLFKGLVTEYPIIKWNIDHALEENSSIGQKKLLSIVELSLYFEFAKLNEFSRVSFVSRSLYLGLIGVIFGLPKRYQPQLSNVFTRVEWIILSVFLVFKQRSNAWKCLLAPTNYLVIKKKKMRDWTSISKQKTSTKKLVFWLVYHTFGVFRQGHRYWAETNYLYIAKTC